MSKHRGQGAQNSRLPGSIYAGEKVHFRKVRWFIFYRWKIQPQISEWGEVTGAKGAKHVGQSLTFESKETQRLKRLDLRPGKRAAFLEAQLRNGKYQSSAG